jgi:hypothetical protein
MVIVMKILHICPSFDSKTCGIGAYTRNLCQGIKEISPESEQIVLNGFSSFYQDFLERKPEVVHIQLEYSFCSPQRLSLIDSYCTLQKVPLFITFHTLGNASHNNVAPCAVKLAHTSLSKDYGVFTLIPSGIPKLEAVFNWKQEGGIVTKFLAEEVKFIWKNNGKSYLFFGQAHRHKQLLETLLAFQQRSEKSLVCVVSKPTQGDLSYFSQCYDLAKTLTNVCWIEGYLNDVEVLTLSYLCKAALFPYVEYGSIGISAAVKLLLNNNDIRICTSYASHFSDIPEELGVVSKYHNIEDMLDVTIEHDKAMRERWVSENNFNEVAKIHLSLYESFKEKL